MGTTSALKRVAKIDQQKAIVDAKTAKTVTASWMDINAVEESLARMDTGILQWRSAPPVQNAMAAMVADMMNTKDTVMVSGFQPYAWMRASGTSLADILSVQLGKMLPANVVAATAEDIESAMQKNRMIIATMHVESAADWKNVRAVSAAAVKAEAPMLLMISAAVDAPKGVAVETAEDWADATVKLRDAMKSVRTSKAIKVVAVADIDAASLEMAMMEAAGVTPEDWQSMVEKNADGAEFAVNAAYQAPVKSF
ncbi:MAG: hypothetical protein EBQ96_00555 [Proteobacteria bacterium]|nr:hypothetical protein [Pseudomonadota bacterium]